MSGTRDIASFNQYSDWIFHNPHTRDDEMSWLEQQGPWCPPLIEHLNRNHRQYDALIFFTYLYAPTVLGLDIDPSRSILVPTAHNEPAIHLSIYQEMFKKAAAVAYNTEVEKNFLKTTFDFRSVAEETVGCGVDLMQEQAQPDDPEPEDEDDRGGSDSLQDVVLDQIALAAQVPREVPAHRSAKVGRCELLPRRHDVAVQMPGADRPGQEAAIVLLEGEVAFDGEPAKRTSVFDQRASAVYLRTGI